MSSCQLKLTIAVPEHLLSHQHRQIPLGRHGSVAPVSGPLPVSGGWDGAHRLPSVPGKRLYRLLKPLQATAVNPENQEARPGGRCLASAPETFIYSFLLAKLSPPSSAQPCGNLQSQSDSAYFLPVSDLTFLPGSSSLTLSAQPYQRFWSPGPSQFFMPPPTDLFAQNPPGQEVQFIYFGFLCISYFQGSFFLLIYTLGRRNPRKQ